MATYTQEQMEQAFDNVKDSTNWKKPIDTTIVNPGQKNLDCLAEVIIFFTGSVPIIAACPKNRVRVVAAGYYHAIGG